MRSMVEGARRGEMVGALAPFQHIGSRTAACRNGVQQGRFEAPRLLGRPHRGASARLVPGNEAEGDQRPELATGMACGIPDEGGEARGRHGLVAVLKGADDHQQPEEAQAGGGGHVREQLGKEFGQGHVRGPPRRGRARSTWPAGSQDHAFLVVAVDEGDPGGHERPLDCLQGRIPDGLSLLEALHGAERHDGFVGEHGLIPLQQGTGGADLAWGDHEATPSRVRSGALHLQL
jgi:hypothetical protein